MPEDVEVPLDELLAGYDPGDPTNEASLAPDDANRGAMTEAAMPVPPRFIVPILWHLLETTPPTPPSAQPSVPWGVGLGTGLAVEVVARMANKAWVDWVREIEWRPSIQPRNLTEEVAQIIGVFINDGLLEGQEPLQLPKQLPKFKRKRKARSHGAIAIHGFTRVGA